MSLSTHNSKSQSSLASSNVLHESIKDIANKDVSLVKTENSETLNKARSELNPSKKANGETQTSYFSASAKPDRLSKNNESLIKQINSREEFDKLKEVKDKYILVWFSASWCGPCKILAIKFQELAQKYRNKIEIFKVDVDELADLALENEVSVMPSYMIMRNGQKLAHYVGTQQTQIDEWVAKYLAGFSAS